MTAPAAPRVRFAPSPTGELHVGSARTSLFNWLFARGTGGTFVLRIEDTDAERSRPEWVDGILSVLSWLGMDPDEGPILQSSRFDRYEVAIDALWAAGALYACDCAREDVDARTKGNATPGYDGHCADRGLARAGRALRFRMPTEGSTTVRDLVRGDVTFPHSSMEDFVLVKSSGQPLFVLANVVDDRDMAISHVIRGEDLLPTTPKGVLVWRALDAAGGEAGGPVDQPIFAHLPMLVNAQRKKLSKRDADLAVEAYRDQGYLAPAFRNYLALLGWSPAGQEKVDVDTLIREFRLEDVHHAPAFFDVKRLAHLNGEYIRELPVGDFIAAAAPWVAPEAGGADGGVAPPPPWPPERFAPAVFSAMAPLVQERVTVLEDVPAMVDFLFQADPVMDQDGWRRIEGDAVAPEILTGAIALYETCEWTTEALRDATVALWQTFDVSSKRAQAPIRMAVTGRTVGPPLFEPLELLGRDEVLRRLRAAAARLGSP